MDTLMFHLELDIVPTKLKSDVVPALGITSYTLNWQFF